MTPDVASSDDTSEASTGEGATESAPAPITETVDTDSNDEPPESDLELMRELDEYLADIDREAPTVRARSPPEAHYQQAGRLGRDTRTQAQIGVEYVRDDGIAVDEDAYIGLLEVTPRNWLSLDEEKRETVMSAYMSFLMRLRSPIVITCYPHEFDLGEHLQQFADVGQSPDTQGESPILQYGRKYYVDWASRRVDEQHIKHRAFYIVTRVEASHVHESLDSGSALSRLPIIGRALDGVRSALGSSDNEDLAREQQCVREVRARQQRLAEDLGRTGVGLELVRDRQETMEILYHYYNHIDPLFDQFDHATRTESATDAPTNTAE